MKSFRWFKTMVMVAVIGLVMGRVLTAYAATTQSDWDERLMQQLKVLSNAAQITRHKGDPDFYNSSSPGNYFNLDRSTFIGSIREGDRICKA